MYSVMKINQRVSILLPTVSLLLYALTPFFVFHFFPFSFFACLCSCFVVLCILIFFQFFFHVSKLLMTDRLDAKQLLLKNYNPFFINSDPFSSRFYPQGNYTFFNFFPFLPVSSSFFLLLPRPSRTIDQIFPFFIVFFSGKGTKWLSCKMKGLIIKYLKKTPKMQVFRGTKTCSCTVKSHGDLHTAMTQWRGQIRLQNGGG